MLARTGLSLCLVLLVGCETAGADADAGGDSSAGSDASETDEGTSAAVVPASIIDHAQWEMLDAVADPLAEHRPATVECGIAGWYIEDDKLEINTNSCNYLAARQPSLVAIEAGQQLGLGFYHFDLVAPEPASAHLAILVEGQLLWETTVEIPGDAHVYTEVFESPLTAPAGAEVVFHLHNHGQNTWALQELIADP
jgi:hypothetical protein